MKFAKVKGYDACKSKGTRWDYHYRSAMIRDALELMCENDLSHISLLLSL